MDLDRKQIKMQARTLIKNKCGALFVITFLVMLLTGAGMFNSSQFNTILEIKDQISDRTGSDFGSRDRHSDNPIEDFDYDDWDLEDDDDDRVQQNNPIEDFDGTGAITPVATTNQTAQVASIGSILGLTSGLWLLAALLLSPLGVTLSGYYVYFVRTAAPVRLDEDLKQVFKNTFNAHYTGRLLLCLLGGGFTFLWTLLFVIPGVVYNYSIYFANELLVDHPNLSPMEALKLSRRMVYGHRGELFRLDLSFILWWLLMICTCGVAGIYVLPYYRTTRALYYQNFRMRALATGQLTEDDFLSEAERMAKYGAYGSYTAPRQDSQPMSGQYNPYTPPTDTAHRSYAQHGYGSSPADGQTGAPTQTAPQAQPMAEQPPTAPEGEEKQNQTE